MSSYAADNQVTYAWPLGSSCGLDWISPSQVRFRVWAPHGERVRVEFEKGTSAELCREPNAPHFWSADVSQLKAGDRYRIVLSSNWNDCYHTEGAELIRRDPYAREVDFDSSWCTLTATQFDWMEFMPPAYNELIIYELHVGSFPLPIAGKSAFELTSERLDHIKELGFNCIQLMPVTEFGGIWGYNPRQLLAVHGKWGSAQQLKCLINRAHSLGLAVIIDVVLNHGSTKLNSLWNWDGYGPHNCGGIYFEGEIETPWGRRFAFHKWEVKEYLKAACRMWIEEYHVDGLRFDSVHNMPWNLLQEMTWEIKRYYPGKILVAEITPENPAVINDAGFDSCWIHAAHFDSLKIMKGHSGGDNPQIRLSLLKSMINMHRGFPRSCSGINSILGSHDQCGDRHGGHQDAGCHRYYISRLGGRNNWHARAQVRMWYALQAVSRGLPMIFMGTETLQDEWWHVDDYHRFNWRLIEDRDIFAKQMMNCMRDVNALRLESRGMTSENIRFVHEDPENNVLGWARWSDEGGNVSLCVAHPGEGQWAGRNYGLSTGWGSDRRWTQVFNSQAPEYGGWDGSGTWGELVSDWEGKIWINLPKWSLSVFRLQ
ncbi:MAG: alpha-amylase family glycosyl hydrolase [Spirochaetota bacterium]